MKKKIIFILLLLLLITGCGNKKISLNSKYYNNSDGFMEADAKKIKNLETDKETFIIFAYNNYCNLKIPCEDIFKEFQSEYKISFYKISFEQMKETDLYNTVEYAPSIIIINKGKIIAYLDANKDEDLNKYQDVKEFKKWLSKYINLKK
jgi:ABC-type glycerol-3-phosphate transport system substrate-binding protein